VLNVGKICNVLAGEAMNICPSKNISIFLVSDVLADTLNTSYIGFQKFGKQDYEVDVIPKGFLGTYSVQPQR
jgi:hypothetical protein